MQAQTIGAADADEVEDMLVHVKLLLPGNDLSKHCFRSFVDPKVLNWLELHVA